MSRPEIRVDVGPDGIATARWLPTEEFDGLQEALTEAAERAFLDGVLRLEAAVPEPDRMSRRALLRSGFRYEGLRRGVTPQPDGTRGDMALFARLSTDAAVGRIGFSGVMNSVLARKRLIAHVLIRGAGPEADRFVLCETRFKPDWELPGGIVEAFEPPRVGAVRELAEELGVDRPVGRLLVADWMPAYLGWDDALELVFDGGAVSAAEVERFVLQPTEIIRAELVTVEQAGELVTPLAHRRLTVALGLGPEETAYLEDGRRTV